MQKPTTPGAQPIEDERQRLLAQLLAAEGLDTPHEAPIVRRDAAAPVPLTFAQELLWLLHRATPGLTAYNSPVARRVRGALDVPALERAFGTLVARHEVLRTVFTPRGDGAEQVILPPSTEVRVAVHDVRPLPVDERERAALAALRAETDAPFDLSREPGLRVALVRIADDERLLLILTHHIVSDAWSYGVLFAELSALYDAATRDVPHALPAVPLQFGDYAAWQRETLHGERLEQSLGYWRERLADLPTLDLPTDWPSRATPGFAGARVAATLSRDLTDGVRSLARAHGATSYMVLLAAFQSVLHRYSEQDDITVGSAMAGRTRREIESTVGYFSQALPMRTSFAGDPTFGELLDRVRDTVLGAVEHQDVPIEPLVQELQRRQARQAPLFRVVLTMQDTGPAELRLGDAHITTVDLDASETKFDLTLLVTERADRIDCVLWYRTELFRRDTAARLLAHFETVVTRVVAEPAARVSGISLLSEPERTQLRAWNATAVAEGAPTTLVELFEAQVARIPDRTAVVSAPETITFAELNGRANQLAHRLRALGVATNAPVGLLVDRSVDALVGVLGILKSGGCYVPLAVDSPAPRIAQQLGECAARVVVTHQALADTLPAGVQVVALDRDAVLLRALPAPNPVPAALPDSLAYVLFTSGSTGLPKGVAVTHANAVHYARAVSRVLGDVPATAGGDGFAALDALQFGMVSTLAADLGNTSLLPSLLSGGTLHVLGSAVTTEPARYAEYVRAHPLDVLKLTPNHLMALVAGKSGAGLRELLPQRWVVLGGEALPVHVARALLGAGACRVLNHYGPTETTVGVCTFEATAATLDAAASDGAQTVPIGRPLANTQAYVVDMHGVEQPVGVPGELWLGGAGVTQGYLHRDDLTRERFLNFAGSRVYRSGDRVRRLSSGALEFLGRRDDQVKVRGYRVELAEIEQALRRHPGIAQAAVLLRADPGADVELVAYVVAQQSGYAVSHSDRPTAESIPAWLAAQLPAYMVPTAVVLLDELPLTANGKVDRARLPKPSRGQGEADSFVAPRTPTETKLAAIWADVLKRDRVGVTDNFLALGGHSLLAIRMLGKISKAFGVRLPLRTLFESPTVEAIAAALDQSAAGGAS